LIWNFSTRRPAAWYVNCCEVRGHSNGLPAGFAMLSPNDAVDSVSSAQDSPPAFRVYSVVPGQGKDDDDWFEIGTAHVRADGKGLVVMLHAQPPNPTLLLRAFSETPREERKLSLAQQVEAFERAIIEQCLRESCGKINVVMERLGIPRRTLSEKMTRLGINRRRFLSAVP
jgi:Bacterial regulatory protein, Fis family